MKYRVACKPTMIEAVSKLLSEYGSVYKSVDPSHYIYDVTCTVSVDDANVLLLQELLTAIRTRQVTRFTVWEPEIMKGQHLPS